MFTLRIVFVLIPFVGVALATSSSLEEQCQNKFTSCGVRGRCDCANLDDDTCENDRCCAACKACVGSLWQRCCEGTDMCNSDEQASEIVSGPLDDANSENFVRTVRGDGWRKKDGYVRASELSEGRTCVVLSKSLPLDECVSHCENFKAVHYRWHRSPGCCECRNSGCQYQPGDENQEPLCQK